MEETIASPSKIPCHEDEELDPRVQIELENLNAATDEINCLEATLEEANNFFRARLAETSNQLQALSKRLGSCVEKARPFYEATEKAKKLQLDCQRSAVQYQRANAVHQAARETISLAEERFSNLSEIRDLKERKFDSAWQEMLNHATMKIMEAEAQKSASEREHLHMAAAFSAAEREVQELQRHLKSAITKSRPYFNHRTSTQIQLEAQKDKIYKLQKDVANAKQKYSLSLRNLEKISEEIHENRRTNMKREPGVGAEENSPLMFVERASDKQLPEEAQNEDDQKYWKNLRMKLDELSENENSSALEQQKKYFSILVHEDNLSLSYEGTDGNRGKTESTFNEKGIINGEKSFAINENQLVMNVIKPLKSCINDNQLKNNDEKQFTPFINEKHLVMNGETASSPSVIEKQNFSCESPMLMKLNSEKNECISKPIVATTKVSVGIIEKEEHQSEKKSSSSLADGSAIKPTFWADSESKPVAPVEGDNRNLIQIHKEDSSTVSEKVDEMPISKPNFVYDAVKKIEALKLEVIDSVVLKGNEIHDKITSDISSSVL